MKRLPAIVLSVTACLAAPASGADEKKFDRKIDWSGISFHVVAKEGSLTITPAGLEGDNSPATVKIDGIVTDAEPGDLDVDGSPEIYVYVQTTDGKNRGSLVAYAANKKRSLSAISFPDLSADLKLAAGYEGCDRFAVAETTLVRTFPLPDGKTRQLQYHLKPGETGPVLKLQKSFDN